MSSGCVAEEYGSVVIVSCWEDGSCVVGPVESKVTDADSTVSDDCSAASVTIDTCDREARITSAVELLSASVVDICTVKFDDAKLRLDFVDCDVVCCSVHCFDCDGVCCSVDFVKYWSVVVHCVDCDVVCCFVNCVNCDANICSDLLVTSDVLKSDNKKNVTASVLKAYRGYWNLNIINNKQSNKQHLTYLIKIRYSVARYARLTLSFITRYL